MKHFRRIDIQAIKRELNAIVDQLAKGATYGEYDKKNKVTTTVVQNVCAIKCKYTLSNK